MPRWVANGDFAVQPYIVMEYVDGPTLLKRYVDQVAPVIEVMTIGIAVAAALADLHEQHVLHLDLKPANILFRPSGEAVLIDFGLSRHEQLPDLLEEQFHRPTGTPDYMAPEQLFRVRSDKRSDIYAFGAVLYQLATGRLRSAGLRACGRCAGASGAIRFRRALCDPRPRPFCRRSFCAASNRCPMLVTAAPSICCSTCATRIWSRLTGRAERMQQSDSRTAFGRRLRAPKTVRDILASATRPPPRPPIILAAVDLRPGLEELRQALLEAAASVLANTPGARLACVNVMSTSLIAIDENVDAAGENIHVQRLAELRSWAQPSATAAGQGLVPSARIAQHRGRHSRFCASNHVDHIVIGAPMRGAGKVVAQVTAEAPCG